MKKIIAVFCLWVASNSVMAGFITGYDLEKARIEYEKSGLGVNYNSFGYSMYDNYILGVVDMAVHLNLICIPMDVKGKQLFSIVGNYLKAHPEKWSNDAHIIVLTSLVKVYPCPKPKPRKD